MPGRLFGGVGGKHWCILKKSIQREKKEFSWREERGFSWREVEWCCGVAEVLARKSPFRRWHS